MLKYLTQNKRQRQLYGYLELSKHFDLSKYLKKICEFGAGVSYVLTETFYNATADYLSKKYQTLTH